MQSTLDVKHSFLYNRCKTNCQIDIENLPDTAESCISQNNMEDTSVIMIVNGVKCQASVQQMRATIVV